MRKVSTNHRSPKLSLNFDKSPSVVGGRQEEFGDKHGMISYWKEMEKEGVKQEIQPMEGGGRRKSQRMSELCGRFEEGGNERSSQPGSGGGREVYRTYLLKSKMIYRIGPV